MKEVRFKVELTEEEGRALHYALTNRRTLANAEILSSAHTKILGGLWEAQNKAKKRHG